MEGGWISQIEILSLYVLVNAGQEEDLGLLGVAHLGGVVTMSLVVGIELGGCESGLGLAVLRAG